GRELRGHEFHYSTLEPPGTALALTSRWGSRAEGHARLTMLATYLHHHPGGDPSTVAAFVDTCAGRREQTVPQSLTDAITTSRAGHDDGGGPPGARRGRRSGRRPGGRGRPLPGDRRDGHRQHDTIRGPRGCADRSERG